MTDLATQPPGARFTRGACSTTIERSAHGYDPDREGIGSSWLGGVYSDALFIPQAPTSSDRTRYLFRLVGHRVPQGEVHHIVSWRQKLTLGTRFTVGQGPGAFDVVKEISVETPGWMSPGCDVLWTFRVIPGSRPRPKLKVPVFNPGNAGPSRTTNPYGTSSALLYLDSGVVGYLPPANGQPPGTPVAGILDTHDVKNTWNDPHRLTHTAIVGPADLCVFASVKLAAVTGPDARPVWTPPPGFDLESLCPEDRFQLAFPDALPRHIGASLLIEVSP